MVLSSYPAGICLSGNLPLFVGTAAPMEIITVQLKKGSEIILEDSFNPDENGNLFVDYRKVVDGLLTVKVPPFIAGAYIQTDAVAQFSATFTSSNGVHVEHVNFSVVKGGVAGLANHTIFLASNFLTWQPQTKEVKYHDPEFLTYYASAAVTVKLKAYYNGSNQVVSLASLTANNLHTVNLNYGFVSSLLNGQPLYYDVWVEDANGDRLTFVQRYVLIDKVFDYESILLFENSIGGIDTIRLTGQIEEKNTATISSGLFDEFVFEFEILPEQAFTINSGYLKNEREKQWSIELLHSTQKYLIIDGALTRVYSDKPELTTTKGELPFFEITLLCSQRLKYLNLARQTNPLPNLTISTNTGSVFFLAPRLNDLPWANSDDVLLPVQFPYEDFFRKISLSSILNGAGGGITLEKDPTVPAWVKSITQDQIGKWDNAVTSAELTNYYNKSELNLILGGYHPLENQRLSTNYAVRFRGLVVDEHLAIPSVPPSELEEGHTYLYAKSIGSTPPLVHVVANLGDLLNISEVGRADGYILYWHEATNTYRFKEDGGGGPPVDLSNYYTKSEIGSIFAGGYPIAGYNKATWDLLNNGSTLSNNIYGSASRLGIASGSLDAQYIVSGGIQGDSLSTVIGKHNNGYVYQFNQAALRAYVGLNDGSTLNNNISGRANTWSGSNNTYVHALKSPLYLMTQEGGQEWGYTPLSYVKSALNINDGSDLWNNIIGSARLWNGQTYDSTSGSQGMPGYLMGYNVAADKWTYQSPSIVKQMLNINDGSTLNNNISGSAARWGGLTYDSTSGSQGIPGYLMGYNTATDKWTYQSPGAIKQMLNFNDDVNPTASTVVRRSPDGYVFAQFFYNANTGLSTSGLTYFTGETSDKYLYRFTPGAAKTALNLPSDSYGYGLDGVLRRGNNAVNNIILTGNIVASSYIQADRLVAGYDSSVPGSINTNDYLRISGNGGVYWVNNGTGLELAGSYAPMLYSQGSAIGLRLATNGGVVRGWLYADNSNQIGFLNPSGGWSMKVNSAGDVVANSFEGTSVKATSKLLIPTVAPVSLNEGEVALYFKKLS